MHNSCGILAIVNEHRTVSVASYGGDLAHVEEIEAHVSNRGGLTSRCGRCRMAGDISMHTNVALAFGAIELWINISCTRFAQNLHFGITYSHSDSFVNA